MRIAGTLDYLVYALLDPTTKVVRYVGRSSSGLRRPKNHQYKDAVQKGGKHLRCWIKSLHSKAVVPEILVLQRCNSIDESCEAEKDYIRLYKHLGARLVNGSEGGEYPSLGYTHTDEAKLKISESTKQYWSDAEHKELRLKAMKEASTSEAKKRHKDSLKSAYHTNSKFKKHVDSLAKKNRSKLKDYTDSCKKPVIAINLETGSKIFFESVNAVKYAGFHLGCVSEILNKKLNSKGTPKRKQHKGFTFVYGGRNN